MDLDELAAWLRLQLTEGVGSATARKLLAAFGLPERVFSQGSGALREVASAAQTQALLEEPSGFSEALRTTWAWLRADPEGRRILALGDPAYPPALLQMEDPPIMLYAMGHAGVWESGHLNALRCISIVGSRNPTPQGAANAHEFGHSFAQSGLTVVSGMALGVDGAAHLGALAGSSDLDPANRCTATIAVVGTGLDRVYPRHHLGLAQQIAAHGLLLSEYPLGTPPLAAHFPQRNRIISGLSLGTLVVEAALKSGSLITARMALEQGRDVFAIPGSIHSTQSRGCHALIKQGAKLVESANDVLEELRCNSTLLGEATSASKVSYADDARDLSHLPDHQRTLLYALGFEPTSLDALQARTGIDTPQLQADLMGLELQGQVRRLAGALFQRLVPA